MGRDTMVSSYDEELKNYRIQSIAFDNTLELQFCELDSIKCSQ
jgi:hypothetical protein